MKQDDIIRMARSVMEERGGSRMDDEEDLIVYSLQLAALVATAEREACAKVCESMRTYVDRHNAVIQSSAKDCAAAIRARENT